ncbi:MAG: hypothetical protein KAI73_05255 [Rhodospirillaceae bacterium]|nr:hypothetical protein [Rhodospirillaceae bacterium]
MMGAVGVPQASIAMCIRDGIDVKTLKEHFGPELKTALIKANAKVAGAMFNKAIKGDVGAGRFWLNCRAGWKETNVNEMTGNPVVNQFVFVPMGVDDEPNKD